MKAPTKPSLLRRKNAFLIKTPYRALEKSDRAAYIAYLTGIVFSVFIIILNTVLDYQLSKIMAIVMLVGFVITLHLYFNLKKYFLSSLIMTVLLNGITLYLSIMLGLVMSYFLYSFVILPCIPLMVKRNKDYLKNSVLFSLITIGFAAFSLVTSQHYGIDNVSFAKATAKLVSNSIVSFVVMLGFIFMIVKMTSEYVDALIIERKNAENEKATKTRVLSNLGHELRTQINSINGITQLMLDQKSTEKLPHETLSYYTDILDVCNAQMLVLVNDILDIHTIESGNFNLVLKPENIGELLSKVTIPFKNKITEKHLEFKIDIDPKLRESNVLLDPTRLTQVIHNLLSNAIKYTHKGYVHFLATIDEETPSTLTLNCAIKDTGIGISNANLDTVFDSFQQVRNEKNPNIGGTGLGLAISKSIIDKMDSNIQVKSKLHIGSTFSFKVTFKKSTLELDDLTKTNAPNTQVLTNKTILITEDNRVSMLYAVKLLEKHGATILQAVNGLEAIDIAEQNSAIDLVLLDLEMPEMNGFTAIKHLKERNPTLKIIAFTANIPDEQLFDKLRDLKFDSFLAKPYKNEDMLSIINKYVS